MNTLDLYPKGNVPLHFPATYTFEEDISIVHQMLHAVDIPRKHFCDIIYTVLNHLANPVVPEFLQPAKLCVWFAGLPLPSSQPFIFFSFIEVI